MPRRNRRYRYRRPVEPVHLELEVSTEQMARSLVDRGLIRCDGPPGLDRPLSAA